MATTANHAIEIRTASFASRETIVCTIRFVKNFRSTLLCVRCWRGRAHRLRELGTAAFFGGAAPTSLRVQGKGLA
jgi:hypothetical protein